MSVGLDILELGQQRRADVAAEVHGAAGGFEHFGDQGGSRRLAVGAGHRDNRAGAQFKEKLDFACHHGAGAQCRLQFRFVVFITGGTQDDVLPGKAVGIPLAKTQTHAQAAQGLGIRAEGFQIGVSGHREGDLRPEGGELFNAGFVADAGADEGDLLAGDHSPQTFDRLHYGFSPLGVMSVNLSIS